MKISVIMSTYNAESWLEKVLIGFSCQTFTDFEIVIADDGSREATKELIERYQKELNIPIIHVWQKDDGFQKSQILNKAIIASRAEYLVFTDGDCIPRKDFLEVHNNYKEVGCFLSGGYYKLPMNISLAITKENIYNFDCFDIKWLKANGMIPSFKDNKLNSTGSKSKLLNFITPTTPSWNGHNASGWKADILAVNGFDERMQYGGQDRELGERMVNFGIKPIQIRYSTVCLHLDHPRGYATRESINKNKKIRKETKESLKKWTPFGILKQEEPNS